VGARPDGLSGAPPPPPPPYEPGPSSHYSFPPLHWSHSQGITARRKDEQAWYTRAIVAPPDSLRPISVEGRPAVVEGVERPDAGVPYIFVSYASVDRERVTPVVEALQRAGIAVWLDQASIAGGENYAREIVEGIEHATAFVLMCSAASLASRNVKQEVGLAWKYERLYLPLLLEPVTIPKEIEYFLEMAQWIEVLGRPERDWLPDALAALQPMGVIPAVATDAPPLALADACAASY
jgi:hypothetical protein